MSFVILPADVEDVRALRVHLCDLGEYRRCGILPRTVSEESHDPGLNEIARHPASDGDATALSRVLSAGAIRGAR